MQNISKAIGSLVGGALSIAVAAFALPAEWASPEMVASITMILATIATYFSPANKPS